MFSSVFVICDHIMTVSNNWLDLITKQNTQDNKKPKFTKCPKLKIAQNTKMFNNTKSPKLQNVQGYKISKVTTLWFFCTIFKFIWPGLYHYWQGLEHWCCLYLCGLNILAY